MINRNKLMGLLFLAFCFIFSIVLTHTTSVGAQEKSYLNSIAFQKMYDWNHQHFYDIQGNHLDAISREVTSETTELQISKEPPAPNEIQFAEVTSPSSPGRYQASFNSPSKGIATFSFLNRPLLKGQKYTVTYYHYIFHGKSTTPSIESEVVATFTVSENDWEGHDNPPTLIASDRTVTKDDPTFNIMDGVSAHDDEGNDITQNVTYTGSVDIHKEGDYHVTYSVTDRNGLSSSKAVQISVKDKTPSLTKPVLDEVTDSDTTINGRGTPNTDIYVILGTSFDTYRAKVKTDGTFIIPLEHPYHAGTSIQAYVQDSQGNKSETYYGVVQTGNITVGVNQILSSDTFVSGYTSPGATVEVAVDNTREHLFTGTANRSGKYNIGMHGLSYPAGTSVRVTATLNNHSSSKTVTIYPKRVSIDTVRVGDSIITGQADPNAVVYLSVHGQNYKFKVDAAGNFRGNISSPVVIGDRITAHQVSNDIESEAVTINVVSK